MIPRVMTKCNDYPSRMLTPPSRASAPGDAALARALALVRDLRARCPWDHAQTRATLRPYLVEEALELDQALKHGEPAELRDELGDVLLHIAFQIVTGEEGGQIDAEAARSALERANDKFRRRFEAVERLAASRGVDVGRASLEELDRLWHEVKTRD